MIEEAYRNVANDPAYQMAQAVGAQASGHHGRGDAEGECPSCGERYWDWAAHRRMYHPRHTEAVWLRVLRWLAQ